MLQKFLATFFNVRAGEGTLLLLLLVQSFFNDVSIVFFDTIANASFLANFGTQQLPYVYILSAFVIVFVGIIYARLESYLSSTRLLISMMLFLLVAILGFYVFFMLTAAKSLGMLLMVWRGVHFTLINLVFWALIGFLFNVRQGKRLFGLIIGGEVAGDVLGGITVTQLVSFMSTVHLILLSAVCIVLSLVFMLYTLRHYAHQFQLNPEEETDIERKPLSKLWQDHYLKLFFILSIVSTIGANFTDFIFYDTVEMVYRSETAIAAFFGTYFAVQGVINLLFTTILSGKLLTRYGVGLGLMALPSVVLVGLGIASVFAQLHMLPNGFFWVVVATTMADVVLRISLETPTFRILYQPFLPSERLYIQGLRESIIEPLAVGLAGVILLVLNNVLHLTGLQIVYITLFILLGWIATAALLRQEYTHVLLNALVKHKLDRGALALHDGSSIAVLQRGLASSHPTEVVYCLALLEELEHQSLVDTLINLLKHPSSMVRISVLQKIEKHLITRAIIEVKQCIIKETDAIAKGAGLRALCALQESEAVEFVINYLQADDLAIKKGAMVGLLRSSGLDGILAAGEILNCLLNSPDVIDRKFAAEVLGDIGITTFYRPLQVLLQDNDLKVRQQAIIATSKLKTPKLIPLLIDNLAYYNLRNSVTVVLTQFGEDALPCITDIFHSNTLNHFARIRLLRVCGRVGGEHMQAFLQQQTAFPIQEVRQQAFESLVICGYQAESHAEKMQTIALIQTATADIAYMLASIRDIGNAPADDLLIRALQQDIKENLLQIFALLSFIYPKRSIQRAKAELLLSLPKAVLKERRAYALEALDNLLAQELKTLLFPLLDDVPLSQQLQHLQSYFPQAVLSREQRLLALLERPREQGTVWTRACVLFRIGQMSDISFYDAVKNIIPCQEEIIHETALWTLDKLELQQCVVISEH
ncbi:HEAT repeat domain-containing protein [Beggiatoa leptomitoformis]|uniref:MFS transporter n=1 Tax=Beggiatoa leptomitoformis TaxID=288004 RepID=A0A2N9YCF0_9GAMM|nr:HEAT repeat domain-containing protein [Beggiatoa leptomitoformis]ALG66568.1 MFS transporter [Beggiatoa leptomitoformis]AUI68132.1 MFS transporter [Beggiatoa leptomitoformis]